MNFIFMGDLHAADKPPSGRVDDYKATVQVKLCDIALKAIEHNVGAVISVGDIFHSKQGNRVSDSLRQMLIDTFKAFPCPVFVVPGNHDMGSAGMDFTNQPLGTLVSAGAVKLLTSIHDSRLGAWLVPRPYNTDAEGFHTGTDATSYSSLTDAERVSIK